MRVCVFFGFCFTTLRKLLNTPRPHTDGIYTALKTVSLVALDTARGALLRGDAPGGRAEIRK